MFGLKTREMIIEACSSVKNMQGNFSIMQENFDKHVEKEGKVQNEIYNLVRECHDSCPETERFNEHTKAQNGTLLRMEKKYDKFYEEHSEVKTTVEGLTNSKKTIKDFLKEIALIIGTIGIICGIVLGFMRYHDNKKSPELVQTERILKELLEKHEEATWQTH